MAEPEKVSIKAGKELAASRLDLSEQCLDSTSVKLLKDYLLAHYRVRDSYFYLDPKTSPPTKAILAESPEQQALIVETIFHLASELHQHGERFQKDGFDQPDRIGNMLLQLAREITRRKLPFSTEQLRAITKILSETNRRLLWQYPTARMVDVVEHHFDEHDADEQIVASLIPVMIHLRELAFGAPEVQSLVAKLERVTGSEPAILEDMLEPWAKAASADLESMPPETAAAWKNLMLHGRDVSGSKPTKKWLKESQKFVETIGFDEFKNHVCHWFELVEQPRTESMEQNYFIRSPLDWTPNHVNILRGLAWCCLLFDDRDLANTLAHVTMTAFKKIPGIGPRNIKLGNAALHALGAMPGTDAVAQLSLLKTKVKQATARKSLEKALIAAAEREGLTPSELEEIAVPTYGLKNVDSHTYEFGDCHAELNIDGKSTTLQWYRADGKQQKSVPASVKSDFASELKKLKANIKEIDKMLSAQAQRIEALYLEQREWEYSVWMKRYHDHPLLGSMSRRLIWEFNEGDHRTTGISTGEVFVDSSDAVISWIGPKTTVRLWHPLYEVMIDEVSAWRNWLYDHEVQQPFKQAYREVYILTDAERRTNTYSNRFAAHILKQHQFHALCETRGWKDRLRMTFDDYYPPAHRVLNNWNLRAEFWVEGASEEFTDSSSFLYLRTDQVRFYHIDAEMRSSHAWGGGYVADRPGTEADQPIPLADIPAIVLSEVMRDVDLFVGVASVGNDPDWVDGAMDGGFAGYWQSYSFGELTATAKTRKEVLEKIIPRLAIAKQCQITDRYLVVKGSMRTYKIHLGSGNILMEPNDQYLCIVARQTVERGAGQIFLPFEGDNLLSIILSKALMLANDTKINDSTITSQIEMHR